MDIVIVEDEQRARRSLRNLITSIDERYVVVAEASDGRKGFEMIRAIRPDVVFTDIRMPVMDGIAMIQGLVNLNIRTRFVILSAHEEFEFARRAVSLGVKEYLVKPITYDEVEEVLRRLERPESKQLHDADQSLSGRYPDAHLLVRKALAVIESSYATRISQEELARSLHVTPEYFSGLFRKDIGESFPRFVNTYRIHMAKALLENSEVAAKDIPIMVGFSDLKYFYKVFRDITGEAFAEYSRRSI